MAQKQLSPERRGFLMEMGAVVMEDFPDFSVDSDGVVGSGWGKWIPIEEQAPLDELFAAMRMVGLDPLGFKFQQYRIIVPNPSHGLKLDLELPAQLVVKGDRYAGEHQLDLVLRSPFVAATEIKSYRRR